MIPAEAAGLRLTRCVSSGKQVGWLGGGGGAARRSRRIAGAGVAGLDVDEGVAHGEALVGVVDEEVTPEHVAVVGDALIVGAAREEQVALPHRVDRDVTARDVVAIGVA